MKNIQLPDGSALSLPDQATGADAAKAISEGLAQHAVAVKVNGTLVDLTTTLPDTCTFEVISDKSPEALEILRHTTAHILAQAVQRLYPQALVTIGPAIENVFYYDFFGVTFTPADLPKIEAEMARIVDEDLPIVRFEKPRAEAKEFFLNRGEKYKAEIIDDLPEEVQTVSLYQQGDYWELCRGPHLPSTKKAGKAFKLTKISAAYWRGDATRESLQRVYGTAFFNEKDLKNYFTLLEEAEKRDHRKLGKALELFYFDPTAPGCPYWLPKGLKMYNILLDFWRQEHEEAGYQEFAGPLMNARTLWETSGHWDHYKDDMYLVTAHDMPETETFALKPMSCPSTMLLFNLKTRSYQDLPIRFSDVDMIHRNEASGALNGMFRVREFHQDDAHIFITENQIEEEFERLFKLADKFYNLFGLSYQMKLSTRPDDFIGEVATWDKAEAILKRILDTKFGPNNYEVKEKDGAFYGPKIDIQMKDALGREWQTGTFQLDFQLAGRFGCQYVDADGQLKTPIVIHRVLYGSLERFFGIITEHFAGAFPVWFSPVQVRILPVSDKHKEHAKEVLSALKAAGIRAELERQTGTIGAQIRQAHLDKIPYAVILGDKEITSHTLSVRDRNNIQKSNISLEDFIAHVQQISSSKSLEL